MVAALYATIPWIGLWQMQCSPSLHTSMGYCRGTWTLEHDREQGTWQYVDMERHRTWPAPVAVFTENGTANFSLARASEVWSVNKYKARICYEKFDEIWMCCF